MYNCSDGLLQGILQPSTSNCIQTIILHNFAHPPLPDSQPNCTFPSPFRENSPSACNCEPCCQHVPAGSHADPRAPECSQRMAAGWNSTGSRSAAAGPDCLPSPAERQHQAEVQGGFFFDCCPLLLHTLLTTRHVNVIREKMISSESQFFECHSSPDDSDTFLHSSDQDIDLQPLNATCSYRGLREVPAPAQPPDSRSRIAIQALTLHTHLPFFFCRPLLRPKSSNQPCTDHAGGL